MCAGDAAGEKMADSDIALLYESHLHEEISPPQTKAGCSSRKASCRVAFVNVSVESGNPSESQALPVWISLPSALTLREETTGQLVLTSGTCRVHSGDNSKALVSPGEEGCHSCHSNVHTRGFTFIFPPLHF